MQRSDRVDATHLTLATCFSKLVLKSGRDDCFELMVFTMYYVSQWVPPILHAMLQRNCPSHYANAFGELGFDCMMKLFLHLAQGLRIPQVCTIGWLTGPIDSQLKFTFVLIFEFKP